MLSQDQIGGMLRTLISAAGGYFVNKGFLTADNVTAIVGAIAPLVALAWSLWVHSEASKIAGVNAIDGKAVVDVRLKQEVM